MTREEVEACFRLSPIKLFAATPIENPYPGSHVIHGPAWDCATRLGAIRLGWRKRVIELSWNQIGVLAHKLPAKDGSTYERWLTDDDTDQGATYVHAWGLHMIPKYLFLLNQKITSPNEFVPFGGFGG